MPLDLGLSRYRPLPGVADELFGPQGLPPLWRPLLALTAEDLLQAQGRADQDLRDSGAFYRRHAPGQSDKRPCPLSHLPVLIPQSDWKRLSAALSQRADSLEAVMADLYGPNDLVRGGHFPAAMIAANPEWLRPLIGVKPPSEHRLHLLAFEIGHRPRRGFCQAARRLSGHRPDHDLRVARLACLPPMSRAICASKGRR